MDNYLLSFCIPTYNRPQRIKALIEQLTSIKSNDIEIVIGDDNPNTNRTEKLVKKYQDDRISYFHNRINLGMDGNLLKTIKKSSGRYVFLLMDDDDVELKNLPWVLKQLRNEDNISQIIGSLGDKREGIKEIYVQFKDKIYTSGLNSLRNLLFCQSHGSSIILKKDSLNLYDALQFIGCLYIQSYLEGQALLDGRTITTSKPLAYHSEIDYKSDQPLYLGKKYWHPISRLRLWKYRIEMIFDLTKDLENKKIIRKILLRSEKTRILSFFKALGSFSNYLVGINIIIQMKIGKSVRFWIYLLLNTFFYYLNIHISILKNFNANYLN